MGLVKTLSITLGLSSLVAGGVAGAQEFRVAPPPPAINYSYGHGYNFGPGRVGVRPDWGWQSRARDAAFTRSLKMQAHQALSDIDFEVQNGTLRPEASGAARSVDAELDTDCAQAMQKGFLTPEDRQHLELHLAQLRDVPTQYAAYQDYGYGGDDDDD